MIRINRRLFKMLSLNMTMMTAIAIASNHDAASDQLLNFIERHPLPVGTLTTSAGAPVSYRDASNTLNTRLLYNNHFLDIITHLSRERIPERCVHSKAAGAYGYFEVTNDLSDICKAKLFNKKGKRTPLITRFSPAVGIKGSSDLARDIRGFATKFYTEDGNLDLVGINSPMYIYNDPRLFNSFVHALKQNSATNILNPNSLWDFLTLEPQGLLVYMIVFGDNGIPDGYRHMPGFAIHTYQVENEQGDTHFVRFHITPDEGIKYLTTEAARRINSQDYDYFTRDLNRAIGKGQFPSWTLSVQVLTPEDVEKIGYNVFDVTRVIPLNEFPLREVGKIVLDKNVKNYFAEIEQLAFNPGNLVPGILGAPDHIFEARNFVYKNAHYHRLGTNYNNILVNCPFQTRPLTYLRDGTPPAGINQRDVPNYYPNSFNGPVPRFFNERTPLIKIVENRAYNLDQARDLYLVMPSDERDRMVDNILSSLTSVVGFLQRRAIRRLTEINPDFGKRILQGLMNNGTLNFLRTEEIEE